MDTQTVLFIILAAILALGLVLFQYYDKSKKWSANVITLAVLRFLTWFSIFLLLINPKFSKDEYKVEKANLVLLSDNSSSIAKYGNETITALKDIQASEEINSKFTIKPYSFGTELNITDSLSFSANATNIANALNKLQKIYTNNTAVVLLSDGNQTFGSDYIYTANNSKLKVYPIAIGDTAQYEDIRINQVNVNKYAFLKNKFPIELFISYEGSNSVNQTVTIALDGKKVYTEKIRLSNTDNTKEINTLLDASSVGTKHLEVTVSEMNGERNVNNNKKSLSVEVIDEKTNVAIVADIIHPDIGVLKTSIENNEQRSVSIIKSTESKLDAIDIFILYQPTASFKSIYEYIQNKKANTFTILGPNANLSFVNGIQKQLRIEDNYPLQEVFPVKNEGFSKFDISKISFDDYPPLDSDVGPIGINGEYEALLTMKIKGVEMSSPLLATLTNGKTKNILLLGQNIWKWRIQDFRNNQSFQDFDELMGKLMLYLADNQSKERLTLDYKSVYDGNSNASIIANYFDETFAFDPNANLYISLKDKATNNTIEIPMLLKNGFYELDLSDRKSGEYQFSVYVKNEKIEKSGTFKILDYDVEQQFVTTNDTKMNQLAEISGGQLFYPNQINSLIRELEENERYIPVQTNTKKVVSLIDFRILLGFIILSLTLEWFIRKYNGLL